MSLDLNANQTAIIAVDGWGSEEGSFSLSIAGPPTPTPTPGDCCTATETASCNEASCSECVCTLDVFCCAVRWDALCAVEAASGCMASCSCAFAATATPTPTGTLLPSPTATGSPSLAPITIDTPADNSFVNASPITVGGSAPGRAVSP
ncbi:hypothetical protein L6Q96_03485 [Candidatus Binatia bacterium]|nr:hypothetical protein [Candidatus Binatia bacterium]